MADFTIRREVLERVFGQKDAARAFENQQAMLATVAEVQTSNVADTARLNDAAFVTLSANAELPNERVLQLGDGLEMIVGDTTVLLRVNDDTARATGGHRVTFIATGDTNVAVPLTGVLATRDNAETLANKTLAAPKLSGLADAADDAAAATAGVPVGGVYRTGSALKFRVA